MSDVWLSAGLMERKQERAWNTSGTRTVFAAWPVLKSRAEETLFCLTVTRLSGASSRPLVSACDGQARDQLAGRRNLRRGIATRSCWCNVLIFYLGAAVLASRNERVRRGGVTLSLYKGAYIAENFIAAAFQSVERGQWEAAKEIGMSYFAQLSLTSCCSRQSTEVPAFTNRMIETSS